MYPPFQSPSGGFEIGRGGGMGNGHMGGQRGRSAHGGGGGRGGGHGGHGGNRSFGGGRGGGRGGRQGGWSSQREFDRFDFPKPNFDQLVPFEKNLYVESPFVAAMSEQEAMAYRARRDITVQGDDVPKPIRTFEEASFPGIVILVC